MMLCYIGKVSLYCYLGCIIVLLTSLFVGITCTTLPNYKNSYIWLPLLGFCLINTIVRIIYNGYNYQVAVRAALLGFTFTLGVYISIFATSAFKVFGMYMCILSVFHYTEFLSIAIIQPAIVSVDSYVINHSVQYTAAAVFSWLEFFLEAYIFPEMKKIYWVSAIGLFICIGGELLRKAAMFTARSNFNHLVQCEKTDDHVLVTHGVYNWCRHPSYVGWFYWSIGTQVILINPFCTLAYALASWHFFKERITFEEITLLNFFGQQYCEYQQSVGTGIPFVHGYQIKPYK